MIWRPSPPIGFNSSYGLLVRHRQINKPSQVIFIAMTGIPFDASNSKILHLLLHPLFRLRTIWPSRGPMEFQGEVPFIRRADGPQRANE